MIRDEHYRAKQLHRARGVDDLERTVSGVCREIDACVERQGIARVLELGCGYGTALLELRARYGSRVELHGLNRFRDDGNAEILLRSATERGLAADVALPQMAYGDVAEGLPFADDTFDLVYSQVAWLYFGNKLGVIREVIRVLRPDGLAKIDADEVQPGLPTEYARLFEIWQDGTLLPFGDYLSRHGMAFAPAPMGEYLRFGKVKRFGNDLMPVYELDLSRIYDHWDGIKCVYVCSVDSTTPSAISASISASS